MIYLYAYLTVLATLVVVDVVWLGPRHLLGFRSDTLARSFLTDGGFLLID